MTEPYSWSETAAGLIGLGGWSPEDRAVELAAKDAERAQARAEFEARVAADPAWSASRRLQESLAARGWTGRWVEVGSSVPPELRALHLAEKAREARTGTWGPTGPTNDVAAEIEQAAADRLEAAQLRQARDNLRLPPGSPR